MGRVAALRKPLCRGVLGAVLAGTAFAVTANACRLRPVEVTLVAAAGEEATLRRLVAAVPLPRGYAPCETQPPRGGSGDGAPYTLRLDIRPLFETDHAASRDASPASSGGDSLTAGRRFLAATARFAEPVYSVSRTEALRRGLVRLEDIRLPDRALAVEELWPGEEGYPFVEELVLSLNAGRDGAQGTLPAVLRRWQEQAIAALRAAEEALAPPRTVAAVGDIALGAADSRALAEGGAAALERLLDGLVPTLHRPIILAANLEGVVSARGADNPRKRFRFRFPESAPHALRSLGFDLVLYANNHGFDFGPEAFLDTLEALERAELPYVGAGRELAAAARAVRFPQRGGGGLAWVGFADFPDERFGFTSAEAAAKDCEPGILTDESRTLATIREAAERGDFVVVLAHGGAEYQTDPLPEIRARYRRFVDAGAGIVFGSHPHVLQGAEAYKGALIAYSLGNFLFTADLEPPESAPSALLEVLVSGGTVRGLRITPLLALADKTIADPDRTSGEARFARLCSALEGAK